MNEPCATDAAARDAVDLAALGREHLLLKLGAVNRLLNGAVDAQAAAAARLERPDLTALCVTDEQVRELLRSVDALAHAEPKLDGPENAEALSDEECAREHELRARAARLLPLDELAHSLALTPFELQAVLLCAAPEIDRRYERVFAYVLDDLNRRQPCVELLAIVGAPDAASALARRHAVGRFGRLRRTGLLLAVGEATSELRQELRIAPALLEWLLSARGDPASFVDPAEIALAASEPLPPGVDEHAFEHLAADLGSGAVTVAGVFGPRGTVQARCVRALAARAGKPLRRLFVESAVALEDGLLAGAALGALVWLDVDPLTEPGNERLRQAVAARLSARRAPIILSGVHPWRPAELLAARSYAEIELEPLDTDARKELWQAALPEASDARRSDLALRFRMSETEMHAVARVARAAARIHGNGEPLPVDSTVDSACATVARRRSDHFATLVTPRHGRRDLVLAPELHKQVLEIVSFFRALPGVSESPRFGRVMSARGGLKALFSGDSGTGKTLAAEVVAGELGLPMLKVDLARVVSKWVGETEKNLETAFREAEDSHSILFFDEADALFGKRGEISHGSDRYANLEVSFLLQRLEEHAGLVILATNLREHIDEAFVRRFHVMLHFPRPALDERRRIWQLALPESAPLGSDVDVDALAKLDLTGAGITSTARTAALLAAGDDATIHMRHLVHAARRQFHREARLLTNADLGRHAHLIGG